jgi:hypothetical protein
VGMDDLLRRLVGILERLELPYLITGSMASTLYGDPRFTNDIDVVVDLPPGRVSAFCSAFPAPEFYLDEERVRHQCYDPLRFSLRRLLRGTLA